MEASGLLDQLNRIHLLSLHLVLLQQINKSLQELTNNNNSNNNNNNNNNNISALGALKQSLSALTIIQMKRI